MTFLRIVAPHEGRWESLSLEVGLDREHSRQVLRSPEIHSADQLLRGLSLPRMESLSLAFSQPFNVGSNDSEDECDEHEEDECDEHEADEEDEDGFSDGKFVQSTPQGFLIRSSSSNRHAHEAADFSHLWAHCKLGSLTLKNFIPSMSPPYRVYISSPYNSVTSMSGTESIPGTFVHCWICLTE